MPAPPTCCSFAISSPDAGASSRSPWPPPATGDSELGGRLAWQLLGAAAATGCLALLWRRGASGRALAAFALSPVVGYQLVHVAHNDALVAHAVLASFAALVLAAALLVPAGRGAALATMLDGRGQSNATSLWNALRGDWATFRWRSRSWRPGGCVIVGRWNR